MKSLRYILSGRPSKLEDCFDLAKRVRPEAVRLKLRACEFLSEHEPMTQFIARLRWTFPGQQIHTDCVCGFVRPDDDPEAVQRALTQANNRLRAMLQQVNAEGLQVLEADQRFETASRKIHATTC